MPEWTAAIELERRKMNVDIIMERYSRAARLTGPKIGTRRPGVAVEGYWLDNNMFFFLAEKFDPSLGRTVAIPSIANCKTQRVEEVISIGELAGLISSQSRQSLTLDVLSSAKFDMPDCDTLAISVTGQDYLVNLRQMIVTKARASLAVPALYSPDGRYACVVKDHNIYVHDLHRGEERPLTADGVVHYAYGQRAETALSAISYRQCPYPMGLWSPDSQWFLTHRIDERSLPDMALLQHAPPGGGRPILHSYKCALPGDPVPIATYVAIHVTSGRVVTFDDFPVPVISSFKAFWLETWFNKDGTACFVRFDRYFKRVDLILLDLAHGTGRIVLSEITASGYLDLHTSIAAPPNVRTLGQSDEIIWFSERDGWGHLYLYDASTGAMKNRITRGEWVVRDIIRIDEDQRKILFLASGLDSNDDPARRCLCSVKFDGSGFEVVLKHDGDIYVPLPRTKPGGLGQDRPFRPSQASAGVSPDGRHCVARYANVERENLTAIVDLRTRQHFIITSTEPASDEVLPRQFTALAADGFTRLHGVMFFPSDFDSNRPYPLIDYIYPGPHSTQQPQSFRSVLSAQSMALAELGFVTMMLDTRGMPIGSRGFHQIGYGSFLEPQLADHAAVVRQLCERYPYIDGDRIGVVGYSAGGTATARAMFDYGDTFKVGVAVCAQDDGSLYSTVWSDHYRGPGDCENWADQANNAVAHKLKGKLLLISGEMDENVHISHTLSISDALIRANRDFDLLIVPNEGHYLLETNGYVQRRMWDYFVYHLLGAVPPRNFELKFDPSEVTRFRNLSWSEAVQM